MKKVQTNYPLSHSFSLLKRIALIVTIFTITRVIFLLYNISAFRPLETSEVIRSFIFGIRFDLSTIFYINIVFLIASLIYFKFTTTKWWQVSLKTLFIVTNGLLILLNLIDTEYFSILKRRSGWDMIDVLIHDESTLFLLKNYIFNYWDLVLIWLALLGGLIFFYPKLKPENPFSYKLSRKAEVLIYSIICIIIMGGGFAVARGIEGKPLRLISANDYVSPKYTPLVLNTPFSIVNTIGHKTLSGRVYKEFSESRELFDSYKIMKNEGDFTNKNVVLIILESFGSEYVFRDKGNSITPFLDSIKTKSLVCTNAYANANNSRDALPAIIGSFPSLAHIDYLGSRYSNNAVMGLPGNLKKMGYHTSFFHGGHNGTMGFDKFVNIIKMDKYFGYNEYIDAKGSFYDDGGWGVYDHAFMQYMTEVVNELPEPFFTTLFTLSSHDPYPIPDEFKSKFKETENPLDRSVSYVDYSLKLWFDEMKSKPWYNNSIFIFVADHTSISNKSNISNIQSKYFIPIIIFDPSGKSVTGEYNKVAQQTDIMPTVLDLLNFNGHFVSYGQSLFENKERFVVNYSELNYCLINSTYTLYYDGENCNALYNYRDSISKQQNLLTDYPEIADTLKTKLNAYIQDYEYRMINNKMSVEQTISKITNPDQPTEIATVKK